jgi:hypothetical protein
LALAAGAQVQRQTLARDKRARAHKLRTLVSHITRHLGAALIRTELKEAANLRVVTRRVPGGDLILFRTSASLEFVSTELRTGLAVYSRL